MAKVDEDEQKILLLANVATMFGKVYTPQIYELWLDVIEEIPFRDLKAGIKELLKKVRFMPSIAEIRDAAFEHFAPQDSSAPIEQMTSEEMHRLLEESERPYDPEKDGPNAY